MRLPITIALVAIACGRHPARDPFDRAANDPKVNQYPGALHIKKMPGLTADERGVEERAARDLEAHVDTYVTRYLAADQRDVDSDHAKELFAEYAASNDTRSRFATAVQAPSSALADAVWRRLLAGPAPATGYVLMTAGGPGSGKSVVVAGEEKELAAGASLIYDGTFANLEESRARVGEALAAGRSVTVLYVHRPVDAEVEGVVRRAIDVGRTVALRVIADKAWRAQSVFLSLADEHAGDAHMRFLVDDNSGAMGTAHRMSIDDLRAARYTGFDDAMARATAAFGPVWDRVHPAEPDKAAALRAALLEGAP
jgi:hypothetical protein